MIETPPIPELLVKMLAEGRWPRNEDEARMQNLRSRIPESKRRALRKIYLYQPPFCTVERIVASGGKDFYSRYGALHELIPEAAVEIADFGIGSDSPILLDYRLSPTNPRVLQLEWSSDNAEANSWVVMADDFASFVDLLGL